MKLLWAEPTRIFRALVVGSMMLMAMMFALDFTAAEPPAEWGAALAMHGSGALPWSLTAMHAALTEPPPSMAWLVLICTAVFGLFALSVYALIGLLGFWRGAREAYIAVLAIGLLDILSGGLGVYLPRESAVLRMTMMLDGAIVAMAYLPPVAARFGRARAGGQS